MLDLATAPLADIAAAEKARRDAEPMPLKTTADMFERMAEWAINNLTDDEQDMAVDLVRSVTPHLTREVSAMYWEDLKEAVDRRNKAEDGEHPGDEDELRWTEQCRAAVDFAAEKLAGVA